MEKKFINSFTSWMETHHEIVAGITLILENIDSSKWSSQFKARFDAQGTGGMYELAEELTDEFEKLFEGEEWGIEKEYFEEIEKFIGEKLY